MSPPQRLSAILSQTGDSIMIKATGPKLGDLSLPADVTVEPPAPGTAKDARDFLGAWIGFWADLLPHVLVVDRLEPDGTVHVFYAVGDAPHFGIARSWNRLRGTIDAGRLVLETPRARIGYELDPKGRLRGSYLTTMGLLSVGTFEPIAVAALRDSDRRVPRPTAGETVRIPHRTLLRPDGARPITLEGTLYRPEDPEDTPLAIFNHGSTGGMFDPRITFHQEAEALWLMQQGFTVLVPMRRGRGASEGVFGEEQSLGSMRQGFEEAMDDLASAIAYGRTLPGVQDGPVLLAGQSRGGILSAAYARRNPDEIAGVMNFAGGWAGEAYNGAFNIELLAEAGGTAGAPQLWLYGERDSYYGVEHIRAMYAAFTGAGGEARLEIFSVPGNGHFLLGFPALWRPAAQAYLDARADAA